MRDHCGRNATPDSQGFPEHLRASTAEQYTTFQVERPIIKARSERSVLASGK